MNGVKLRLESCEDRAVPNATLPDWDFSIAASSMGIYSDTVVDSPAAAFEFEITGSDVLEIDLEGPAGSNFGIQIVDDNDAVYMEDLDGDVDGFYSIESGTYSVLVMLIVLPGEEGESPTLASGDPINVRPNPPAQPDPSNSWWSDWLTGWEQEHNKYDLFFEEGPDLYIPPDTPMPPIIPAPGAFNPYGGGQHGINSGNNGGN